MMLSTWLIIFYFENLAFFNTPHSPQVCGVDNQTFGDNLKDFNWTIVEKSPSALNPPMGIEANFWWRDALSHQPVRIKEETLESGNLFSVSWISASVYTKLYNNN